MAGPLTGEKIAELREMERAEPPAPWLPRPDGQFLCEERRTLYRAADAVEFLCAARNALPGLLEERETLRGLLAKRAAEVLRAKQWARFLFCYVRGDRERDEAYEAELRKVFEEHYPQE